MKKCIEKHTLLYLLFVHLFVVVLRSLFVLYGNIDLHTEEAQYWTWSQHLDWSYYSKPPMVSILNYLSESIFGHSEFSVRINAILFGFLTAVVSYLFTKELFQDKFKAFIASVLVYAMPFYQSTALFFSTDAPLLFFAIWAMYLGWMAISYDKWKYWLGFAVALGLGYLSKYAMLFFVPTTLLFIFIKERSVLRNPRLYITLLLSFLFFLPVIIWNFKYDFIGLKHIIHLSGATSQAPNPLLRRIKKLAEYVGGQLAIISPLFLVYYFRAFKKFKTEKTIFYLCLPALIAFLIFFVIAITKRSGSNVNWVMFAYVGLPILLAHYIVSAQKIFSSLFLFFATIIITVLVSNASLIDKIGLGNLYSAKIDPLKKLVGWEELAHTVDSIENALKTDKVFVFTDSYHSTSELRFYNYPKKHYYYANRGNRMTQFSLWKGIEQFENQKYTAIFITDNDISEGNYQEQPPRVLPEDIAAAFNNHYSYHSHITYYRGKAIKQYHIYTLHNFKKLKTQTKDY